MSHSPSSPPTSSREKLYYYTYALAPPLLHGEVSFSESFFQLPSSLNVSLSADTSSAAHIAELGSTQQAPLLFLPETQYSTPALSNTSINITADQSVLLPSLPSVLEATVRSAQKRRSLLGVPVQVKMADRLMGGFEESGASPFIGKGTIEDDDSLLMALIDDDEVLASQLPMQVDNVQTLSAVLEQSMTIASRSSSPHLPAHPLVKFSQDFLNTLPLPNGTQGVLQACAPSQSIDAELSGIADSTPGARSGEFVPGSETDLDEESSSQDLMGEDEGHDSVIFPASFDDNNNPFLNTFPQRNENATMNDCNVKDTKTTAIDTSEQMKPSFVLVQSPMRQNSKTITSQTPLKTPSGAVAMNSLVKKGLEARIKHAELAVPVKQSIEERVAASMRLHLVTEAPRTPCAEPRKTPLPASSSLSSMKTSASMIVTPRKMVESVVSTTATTTAMKSESASPITLGSASESPVGLPANQLVFFKDPDAPAALFTCGVVVEKASRTRELWRIKSCSSGYIYSLRPGEMVAVGQLHAEDRIFSYSSKAKTAGPFNFKGFSEDGRSAAVNSADAETVKLSRLAIGKDEFTKLLGRPQENISIPIPSVPASIMSSPTIKKRSSILSTTNTDSPAKRFKPADLLNGMRFLITCADDANDLKKYSQLIESQGGELLSGLDAEVPALKTFLLAPGFKRTPKFMTAIIRGIPRASFAWIDACLEQKRVLDVVPFTIEPPSGWKPTGALFKGRRFFLDGSAKFKSSWMPVLRLLGGTVSASLGGSGAGKVLAFVEDAEKRQGGGKGCERIVNVDWLIRCIVERTFVE